MTKICAYARVSIPQQSLEAQLVEIKKYCDFRNFEVMNVYTDKASGKNTERPGFHKMMIDLEINPLGVEAIVVYKLDRIGRSIRDLINFTDFIKNKNIGLISISNNIDTTTKEGRLFFYLMSAIAEYERELIMERTTIGREIALQKGVKMGKTKLNIDMDNVKKQIASGVPISKIARDLHIHRTTIYNRLEDKKYGGN